MKVMNEKTRKEKKRHEKDSITSIFISCPLTFVHQKLLIRERKEWKGR